jgi:integrase
MRICADFHINKGGILPSRAEAEAVARRRFQNPTPRIRGNWWVIDYREDEFIDGKLIRKQKQKKIAPAAKSVREVMKIRDEEMRPFNQGLLTAGSAIPFDEYVRQVYRVAKLPLMAAPSRGRYDGVLDNYLLPAFGTMMLREITPQVIQSFMTGIATRSALGLESRRKILTVLSSVLATAKRFGHLSVNHCEDIDLGRMRAGRRQKPYVTPEQFSALVQLIAEPYATMLYVDVMTGLRISELVALKWRNLGPDSITIEERCCRGDWSAPKSAASEATISVNSHVLARIHRLKEITVEVRAGRALRKLKAVRASGPDDLVFQPLMRGRVMRDNNMLVRHIKPAACELSMRCVNCGQQPEEHEKIITCPGYKKGADLSFVNWRCLRTSHAVWLKLAGADVKDAQAQMRHSRASTTLDIYQQFVPESQRTVVDKLDLISKRDSVSQRPLFRVN